MAATACWVDKNQCWRRSERRKSKTRCRICWIVVRSDDAKLIAATTIPAIDNDINQIELLAARYGLSWANKKFGPSLIWLEGDSKTIVEILNQTAHHHDDPNLIDCKIFFNIMHAFKVSHIYREGNSGADFMVNLGCAADECTLWEDAFPAEIAISDRDKGAHYVRV